MNQRTILVGLTIVTLGLAVSDVVLLAKLDRLSQRVADDAISQAKLNLLLLKLLETKNSK